MNAADPERPEAGADPGSPGPKAPEADTGRPSATNGSTPEPAAQVVELAGRSRSRTGAADAVAAGADRAGGERARRRRRVTPLLEAAAARPVPAGPDDPEPDGSDPVTPEPGTAEPGGAGARRDSAAAVADAQHPPPAPPHVRPAGPAAGAPTVPEPRPGPRVRPRPAAQDAARQAADLGEALVDALPADADDQQITAAVASALDFLRRRLTGEYEVDDYGFDPELTDTVLLALLRPLYRRWFRVQVHGVENVPAAGGALVVANHSGTIALDALMTQIALRDEHPAGRRLRLLGADLVFRTPVLGDLARKSGTTLASNADAESLLVDGHVVGVFPEGFKGIGKPFSERYKLQRFGRGGFVSAALKTRTPIVPCAIVGAEEIYPIIARSGTVARLLNLPYAPITPTWPLLGPLGLVPLPSKWYIEFGEPIWTSELDEHGAEDPMLLFDLTDRVRETIQQNLYSLLMQRRSVFF